MAVSCRCRRLSLTSDTRHRSGRATRASATVGNRYGAIVSRGHHPRESAASQGKCPYSSTSSGAYRGELRRCRLGARIPVTAVKRRHSLQQRMEPPGQPSMSYRDASQRRSSRRSQQCRSVNHHPQCFYYGEADRVYRHWSYRRLGLSLFPPLAARRQRNERPQKIEDYLGQLRSTPQSSF